MTQCLVCPPPPSGVRGKDLASAPAEPLARRGGNAHSQAVSLKDSDGSELIGAMFVFILDDWWDFFFISLILLFCFSEASVSLLCVSFILCIPLSSHLTVAAVVVVDVVVVEAVLPAREAESAVFQ